MKLLIILIFLAMACSVPTSNVSKANEDQFDYILYAMKTRDPISLQKRWGMPEKIEPIDDTTEKLVYKGNEELSPLDVVLNKKDGKIKHASIFFWKKADNYAYLKERFINYKWVETPQFVPIGDVESEPITVFIPDLKISFEYDNQTPERKVMWIGFE